MIVGCLWLFWIGVCIDGLGVFDLLDWLVVCKCFVYLGFVGCICCCIVWLCLLWGACLGCCCLCDYCCGFGICCLVVLVGCLCVFCCWFRVSFGLFGGCCLLLIVLGATTLMWCGLGLVYVNIYACCLLCIVIRLFGYAVHFDVFDAC